MPTFAICCLDFVSVIVLDTLPATAMLGIVGMPQQPS